MNGGSGANKEGVNGGGGVNGRGGGGVINNIV